MKSYYEQTRDESRELLIQKDRGEPFPAHFHRNLEVVVTGKGRYEFSINGNSFVWSGAGVLVIDSFDIHCHLHLGADENGERKNRILVIPYGYMQDFIAGRRGLSICERLITDAELSCRLIRIVDEYLDGAECESVRRSAVGLFLSILNERIVWKERKGKDETELVREILTYIQEHYREDISRETVAKTLGYTVSHISRVFHRYLRMGIPEYINGVRLEYVERMRSSGDTRTMLELIYDAGFNSQQTYYRCRKNATQKRRGELS